MQIEAGEFKLLLFETFLLFFFFFPTGSIEELALLKIKALMGGDGLSLIGEKSAIFCVVIGNKEGFFSQQNNNVLYRKH